MRLLAALSLASGGRAVVGGCGTRGLAPPTDVEDEAKELVHVAVVEPNKILKTTDYYDVDKVDLVREIIQVKVSHES